MSKKAAQAVHQAHSKTIAYWLLSCCGLVITMIIIGAITRLTESGLSMVEWRPLMGAMHPLTEEEWARIFNLYKDSPQFVVENSWMALEDFKTIFFWEWIHRLLGRLIGLTYILPLLFFVIKGWIPSKETLKLGGIFILGGLQGFMGWYMVQSGLVDNPAVSHYRLAAHLLLALLILCTMFWMALRFLNIKVSRRPELKTHGLFALVTLIITITWGAFVAGLDAGLIYSDSFPLMGGKILPPDIWYHKPLWQNFFTQHSGVQFTHRWLAMGSGLVLLSLAWRGVKKAEGSNAFLLLGVVTLLQITLGISTLFSGIEISLAVLHQTGAVALLLTLVYVIHQISGKKT